MTEFANWMGDNAAHMAEIRFSAMDMVIMAILLLLAVSLVICIVKDEPLWYIEHPNGAKYAYCLRRGKIRVREGNDNVQESEQ